MPNVFAVPVFFICFRECLECSIIVSVLLAFLKQTLGPDHDAAMRKRLVKQVWIGIGSGVLICLVIAAGLIAVWYTKGTQAFNAAENVWEGVFGLIASIIITLMGGALLRVNKMQDKWRVKIAKALETKESSSPLAMKGRVKQWSEKYAMFLLPFITVLREGIEAILFIAGVGLGMPATSFPLPVICGLAAGILVGYLIYRGGNTASLQIFLIMSTCFLYLVAAGLFSKAVWYFEANNWSKIAGADATEAGAGPGSYDIRKSVWHVNCCSPSLNNAGGWGIFNSLFGWQNSATYGSVISYNLYWLAVIAGFLVMGYLEQRGHWRSKATPTDAESDTSSPVEQIMDKKNDGAGISSDVREITE